MTSNTSLWIALLVVAIIAVAGVFTPAYAPTVIPQLGGTTNFDDLDIDTLVVGDGSATSSVNLGKACITMKTVTGNTVYWVANSTGSLATSSVSCN